MILSAICVFIYGVAKAFSDLMSEGNMNIPVSWRKGVSWENKWDTPLQPNRRPEWLYLWIFTPQYNERFLYSSSWFVNLTDFWHKFETLRAFAVVFAVVNAGVYPLTLHPILYLLIFYMTYIIGFSFTYRTIKYWI